VVAARNWPSTTRPTPTTPDSLIGALGQLRRALGGQKATLLWDGLPAHRSRVMRAWLGCQRSWLVVEPLPG
jgi:putative transposase